MLKTKRLEAGLSQAKLSKAAGIPLRTYQDIESRGIEHALVSNAVKISRVLGCTIDELLNGTAPPQERQYAGED